LLTITLAGPPRVAVWTPPASLRTITPIDTTGASTITSMFGHTMPDANGDVTFFVQMKNGMPLPMAAVTAADAPTVTVGDTVIWEVNNMTGGMHNFHLHGFKFQLIETQWLDMDTPANNYTIPAPYLEWKDTIGMPERPGAMGRSRTITRLAVQIDDTGREGLAEAYGKVPSLGFSGGWLFHCHLLEHAARGMMSFLQVMNPVEAAVGEQLQPRSTSERLGVRSTGERRGGRTLKR